MGKGWLRWRLPEDPFRVLPDLPEEGFLEDFWKKGSSGNTERSSGRTGLLESFRNTSSRNSLDEVVLPETFRKKGSSG